MKLGEICELIASPDYAYKDGKTLKFEVELFETLGSDVSRNKDGSIRKSIIRKGKDIYNPVAGAEATIVFRNLTDSTEDVEVTYCVGDPPLTVPEELDQCLRHMSTDEFCRVVVCKDKNSAAEVADKSRVVYELTLKSFEKTKHLSGISPFSEQMAYANVLKEKANNFLKDSKFDSAIELYKRLDDELQYIVANGPAEQKELSAVIVAVRLNLGLTYLKLCKPDKCIEFCRKVLDVFGNNEKALFRMGQAHLLRNDHDEALVYFKKIVAKNPNNASAVKLLHMCEEEIQKAKDMAKKRFRSIFERCKDSGLDGVEEHKDGVALNGEKSAL
ncbi:putative immunophilin [Schistosoma mansoni]|nr:putative immunophilin [Schistosoma mansoni]|eukprot:XP_018650454.1 putative immunophilin [Schistosoma mansoni]